MTASEKRRDAGKTRREVLVATARALQGKGAGASISDIAAAAGISKGGLLHHFPNRDALLFAVAENALAELREHVTSRVDLSENQPGKLLRAFVRALCGADPSARAHYEPTSFWSALSATPGVSELIDRDNAWWHSELKRDGLSAERITLVRYAAEGAALAATSDRTFSGAALSRLESVLLELTLEKTLPQLERE